MVGLGSTIPPQELQNGWNTCKSLSDLQVVGTEFFGPEYGLVWVLASDLSQICRRFGGRSSEAAVMSFDIAFIDPAFGVRYGKGLCHSFLLCLPH